jgi:hypothetical protein
MATIVEVLFAPWVFRLVASNPVLWAVIGYFVGTLLVAAAMISWQERSVRWLLDALRGFARDTRASMRYRY